jgi:hypothetical protein
LSKFSKLSRPPVSMRQAPEPGPEAVRCRALFFLCALAPSLRGQEASSGVDLQATVTGQAVYSHELTQPPRSGRPLEEGLRAVLYPVWKLGDNWAVTGAVQINSLPYFYEDFPTTRRGLKTGVLQAALGYYRVWEHASVAVRAGQLQSAFGSFLLRYDDAKNPLFSTPLQYSYDSGGVSTLGLTGIQVDATRGKWDARAQFVNSSPANPRALPDKDQYGNGAGGIGYTFLQGLRAGVSAYHGPYLARSDPAWNDGPKTPKQLPATAWSAEGEWAHGHWNMAGEWQHFIQPRNILPVYRQDAAYVEAKRVLHPRLYLAVREGFLHCNAQAGEESYELTAGFRLNTHQLMKAGFIIGTTSAGELHRTFGLQLITTVHPFSRAWK